MAPPSRLVPLAGTERVPVPGARAVRPIPPDQRVEVTVRVRPRPSAAKLPSPDEIGALLPKDRHYLSRKAYASAHGADPADLAKIKQFAKAHGLEVVESSPARRSVVLAGTAARMSEAFQVKLMQFSSPRGDYRGRVGPVHVPDDLVPIIEGVFGLDNRRQARPHFIPRQEKGRIVRATAQAGYTPLQVADLYNFPGGLDGTGQCIGILEFGGGYTTADLKAYFKYLGVPLPQVTAVSVDGAKNKPGDPEVDGEVMLDIEVAGAVAPGAKIVVYFAPFTERGWVDALTTAIHDDQNRPSVLSVSWGFAEGHLIWTDAAVQAVNQALGAAAAIGVSVCVASGDDGSDDDVHDGHAHVDFPAASPYALGCGGTTLKSANGQITSETVWNNGPRDVVNGGATGGGVSDVFDPPAWQGSLVPPSVNPGGRRGRGVPDVSGDADENTGYIIRVQGKMGTTGGTSAVAPLWAGLIARFNQALPQPLGYFNPLLYQTLGPAGIFRDITQGDNDTTGQIGGYPAGRGWDPCTGWGSPDGARLLAALGGQPPAAAGPKKRKPHK